MFDNLLFQNTKDLLTDDIKGGRLPGALLFSGPEASGKLTCALETARILSCTNKPKGSWTCECPSCLRHKALVSQNVMLLGPRDCTLEISACKKTFLISAYKNDTHVPATRYLFIRSVRKLTNRFNPILWQDSKELSKIAGFSSAIDELLEEIDPIRELPPYEKLEKLCEDILKQCIKLEEELMYDTIPILQIRNLSSWAHIGAADGMKVIIIEKADRMPEGVRNALLKILEEPPRNTVFILTTTRRSAVMPTILSRVRTYNFSERNIEQNTNIISRIFHEETDSSIENYFQTFLPVSPDIIAEQSEKFYSEIIHGKIPDVAKILLECKKFEPRVLFRMFLNNIQKIQHRNINTPAMTEAVFETNEVLKKCYSNVTTYYQSRQNAMEALVRDIAYINKKYENILRTNYDQLQ